MHRAGQRVGGAFWVRHPADAGIHGLDPTSTIWTAQSVGKNKRCPDIVPASIILTAAANKLRCKVWGLLIVVVIPRNHAYVVCGSRTRESLVHG